MSGITVRASINDEVDGISAPKMGLARPFYPGKAAIRTLISRIDLPGDARSKLAAGQTNLGQNIQPERILLG
jgi:hypothetical protein